MNRSCWAFLLLVVAATPALGVPDNDTCMACHGQEGMGAPVVDAGKFSASIHGQNLCVSCHRDVTDVPHEPKLKPVSCRACHRLESEVYLQSDHGRALSKGKSEAATCTSCHGHSHTLLSSRHPDSPVNRLNLPKTCGACHSDLERMKDIRLSEKQPVDTYEHSVHGEALRRGIRNAAVCSDCHGTHDLHSASNPLSKVYRNNVPNTCGKCHENVSQVYGRSVHGKAAKSGIKESPVCTDCHGEHTIRAVNDPQSPVSPAAISRTCSSCHDSEKIVSKFGLPGNRLMSYQSSYHGLAMKLGDLRAANCASCHGFHDVLPSYDTRSSIHPNNLDQTCGRCHTGAQIRVSFGSVHGDSSSKPHVLFSFFRLFYLILIPVIIGSMILHNAIDYVRKAIVGDAPSTVTAKEASIVRMNAQERVQHLALTVSFVVLAVSGFALKYPDSVWSLPFQSGGEAFRKLVHRGTALIFSLVGLWHIFYMLISRRGRFILRHRLAPTFNDLVDPVRLIAYNLGLRKSRPHLPYPSYIEKAEYWALIWGSLIMVLTGSLLVFNDFTLKHFPLWISNLATMVHFYEAVLATLSILVWHMYWAVFDPAAYPMNWSWITGRFRRGKPRR